MLFIFLYVNQTVPLVAFPPIQFPRQNECPPFVFFSDDSVTVSSLQPHNSDCVVELAQKIVFFCRNYIYNRFFCQTIVMENALRIIDKLPLVYYNNHIIRIMLYFDTSGLSRDRVFVFAYNGSRRSQRYRCVWCSRLSDRVCPQA